MPRMARERTEAEQKAVETILWALGHKLQRMLEEHRTDELRGQGEPGVAKGLEMALSEVNDLLPRRKRIR